MEELIKLESYPVRGLVGRLLQDKTTRKNIIFASESYSDCGTGYKDHSQMTEDVLLGFDSCDIQPRVYKTASEQTKRTRKRAEVFTPAWIVNLMNNHCDAEWFGRTDVFKSSQTRSHFRREKTGSSMSIQGGWRSPAVKRPTSCPAMTPLPENSFLSSGA